MQKTETVEANETVDSVDSLAAQSAAPDRGTIQSSDERVSGRPAADLEQKPGCRISRRELPGILKLHQQWLVLDGTEGKCADLSAAQLQEIDLTGADLRRAILFKVNFESAELFMAQFQGALLTQANLAGANLLGAQFRGADLQCANLDNANGLQMGQLAGANLRGAILPDSLSEASATETVRELSKSVMAMLAAILFVCALAFERVVTVTDAQLIKDSPTLPFLHLGNFLPMTAFFLMAPVLLLGLCIAMHLRLLRLWEAVEQSPEIFPNGKRLSDCGSWMVMALGFFQFEWLRGRHLTLAWLESVVASFLAYWTPPLVLLAFWARYLTLQDLRGSILDVVMVVSAIGLAAILPGLSARKLFRLSNFEQPYKSLWQNFELRLRAYWLLTIALTLSLLSVGVVHGVPHSVTGDSRPVTAHVAAWAADIFWLAHIDPYANLAEQDISTRPPNANRQDDVLDRTLGARLRGRNLRHAQGYNSFLVKADLWETNLDSADLSGADLRLADLHRSLLRSALLKRAQLFRANLEDSDLQGANLSGANLNEANLSSVLLSDAILSEASLKSANLYGADLHSSQFSNANLQGADLRGANLEHAGLIDAELQGSYLSSAKFFGADMRRAQLGRAFLIEADLRQTNLRDADLRGATLADADLRGANLEGADLLEASGLTVAQICSARINNETQLDVNLTAEVSASCPQK